VPFTPPAFITNIIIESSEIQVTKIEDSTQQTEGSDQPLPSEIILSTPVEPPKPLFPKTEVRKYNIDIMPCLLWSQGPVIDLLIRSGVSRYLEFKCLEQSLMVMEGTLRQVPCSKADVFKNKYISLKEKRQLMKFLSSITQPTEEDQASLLENIEKPFIELLESRGLSSILQSFIMYAIALIDKNQTEREHQITTKEGLELMKSFMSSVSKYGNTPFLVPLYGTSELAQAFCRLAAVFGATYLLQQTATQLVIEDGKCVGIVNSTGQRITTDYIIANPEHLSPLVKLEKKSISRCICITDRSLSDEDLLVIRIPPGVHNNAYAITVIQLSASTMSCPAGKYLVHFTTSATNTAQFDLDLVVKTMFNHKSNSAPDEKKPNILWNCYYNHLVRSVLGPLPENVIITQDPEHFFGCEKMLAEAETIFRKICPEEEQFISPVPHPEDIIYEPGDSNDGNVDLQNPLDSHQSKDESDPTV